MINEIEEIEMVNLEVGEVFVIVRIRKDMEIDFF